LDVLVFSDSRKVKESFRIRRKNNFFSPPSFCPQGSLRKKLKEAEPGSLVYIDLSGLDSKDVSKELRSLSRQSDVFYGVVDPAGIINDVAGLFHDGAVDYVDKNTLREGITLKRLNQVTRYLSEVRNLDLDEVNRAGAVQPSQHYISSGRDWKNIVDGREYTFCFMYIELDDSVEMERKYGRKTLSSALSSFRRFIESAIRPFNGRVWIWSGIGGIILFPFDLRSSDALKCGFRIMLIKTLYDVEESVFPNFLSFRTALHIGNTIYQKEDTGNIISDSLNYIFHLGQQFAEKGNFYITEEVLLISHSAFLEYFVDEGEYEGRKIFRMRAPIHMGSSI